MSAKKSHQHYIPKCYLKNFGFSEDDSSKFFVHAKLKDTEIKKYSIRDICVEKNLYTLPVKHEREDKFFLENFYAENIDNEYPKIYNILTDESISEIDEKTRKQIIFVCLSLYFRTPKFLRLQNKLLEDSLAYLEAAQKNNSSISSFKFQGKQFDLNKNSISEIRAELKKENRIQFLLGHLELLQEFIVFIQHHAIGVNKIVDNSELITCDNPVNISNSFTNNFTLFDPNNSIKFPLNNKFYLTIIPNWTNDNLNYIFRSDVLFDFALTTNLDTEKHKEDWLIGSEKGLQQHFVDQSSHKDFTPENIVWLENARLRALLLNEAFEIFQKFGFDHPLSIQKIQILKTNQILKKEPQIQNILKLLKEKGYDY